MNKSVRTNLVFVVGSKITGFYSIVYKSIIVIFKLLK